MNTFSLGTIAVGQTATFTIWDQSTEDGTTSDTDVDSSSASDPNSINNTAVNIVSVPGPASILLMALALAGLAFAISRR